MLFTQNNYRNEDNTNWAIVIPVLFDGTNDTPGVCCYSQYFKLAEHKSEATQALE
jgi:hypothetical protein